MLAAKIHVHHPHLTSVTLLRNQAWQQPHAKIIHVQNETGLRFTAWLIQVELTLYFFFVEPPSLRLLWSWCVPHLINPKKRKANFENVPSWEFLPVTPSLQITLESQSYPVPDYSSLSSKKVTEDRGLSSGGGRFTSDRAELAVIMGLPQSHHCE